MTGPVSVAPWGTVPTPVVEASAFARLWRGFANARVATAAVLLLLLAALFSVQPHASLHTGILGICVVYLMATVAARAMPTVPRRDFGLAWLFIIGIDLATIATLEYLQAGGVNFSPLLAVPVLMASVLGSGRLAFATAAAVALLLLAKAMLGALEFPAESAQRFLQGGLTGLAYFVLAFLAYQLSGRLAREEQNARNSQDAARVQSHVNQLVIETLADGVLVVDAQGHVRAANPTACSLLGHGSAAPGFMLSDRSGWLPLLELTQRTIVSQVNQLSETVIGNEAEPQRPVLVRTRLAGHDADAGKLCVVFMEDLREMEARLHTGKLAALGRMSAAVAHEIRNPLSAIAQANALLGEELTDPAQRQLSALVHQNAQRLARIVEDILNVARVQQQVGTDSTSLALDSAVAGTCQDWARQSDSTARLRTGLRARDVQAVFEPDHLRRVLVNLLDNAARHAGRASDSIQVSTRCEGAELTLWVWSDGPRLEPTVRQHMFEPFFSSESRSSGLGLYICRELCERHGAQIGYQRSPAPLGAQPEGNAFFIRFRRAAQAPAPAAAAARIRA